MKHSAQRIFAVFLTCIFINFVFMNTVFVHTHLLSDGSAVSHSHPYLPSAHHGHSQAALLSIAQYNTDAATMEGSAYYAHTFFKTGWKTCACDVIVRFIKINVISKALRGPPAL